MKCLRLAVSKVTLSSMAAAAIKASANWRPCDNAKVSIRSAARAEVLELTGMIWVLRLSNPFLSRCNSSLLAQPCANSM